MKLFMSQVLSNGSLPLEETQEDGDSLERVGKMAGQEDPELTSSHGHTKVAATFVQLTLNTT